MTWMLRALLATGGGLLMVAVSAVLAAAPAHAQPPEHIDPVGLTAPVAAVVAPVADRAAVPVAAAIAPVADVVHDVAAPTAAAQRAEVLAPVTRAVDPVTRAVDPVTRAVDPVTRAVDPVTRAVDPVTRAVDPVIRAVDPVIRAVDPVTRAVDPVTRAVDPVTRAVWPVTRALQVAVSGLHPVTGALLPGATPGADERLTATAATVPGTGRASELIAPEPLASTALELPVVTSGDVRSADVPARAEVAPVRAPHRHPGAPDSDRVALPASGAASAGTVRGAVDGDVPAGVQPPELRTVSTRAGPCPDPSPGPHLEIPDSPA